MDESPAGDGHFHQTKCKVCGWVGPEREGLRGKMAAARDYLDHYKATHPDSPYMMDNRVMRRKPVKKVEGTPVMPAAEV